MSKPAKPDLSALLLPKTEPNRQRRSRQMRQAARPTPTPSVCGLPRKPTEICAATWQPRRKKRASASPTRR